MPSHWTTKFVSKGVIQGALKPFSCLWEACVHTDMHTVVNGQTNHHQLWHGPHLRPSPGIGDSVRVRQRYSFFFTVCTARTVDPHGPGDLPECCAVPGILSERLLRKRPMLAIGRDARRRRRRHEHCKGSTRTGEGGLAPASL